MKKLTPLAASTLILSSLIFGGPALADTTAQPVQATQEGKSTDFLFVITSPTSELKQLDKYNYQLIIPTKEIKSILAFSDRPERIVKHLSPSEYVKIVDSGQNSFIKNPPNVAVNIADHGSVVFEVLQAIRTDNQITYHLRLLDNQQSPNSMSGSVSLFIDASLGWSGPTGGGDFPF